MTAFIVVSRAVRPYLLSMLNWLKSRVSVARRSPCVNAPKLSNLHRKNIQLLYLKSYSTVICINVQKTVNIKIMVFFLPPENVMELKKDHSKCGKEITVFFHQQK